MLYYTVLFDNLVGTHMKMSSYNVYNEVKGVTCMLMISQQGLLQLLVSTILLFVTHQLL